MHDYKPNFKQTKRQISRKFILFVIISIASTFFFLQKEKKQSSDFISTEIFEKTPQTIVKQPLQLPNKTKFLNHDTVQQTTTALPAPIKKPTETQPPSNEQHQATKNNPSPKQHTSQNMSPSWETHHIISGDSIANIFKDWKLSPTTLYKIIHSSKLAKTLANIRPGETLKLLREDNGALLKLMVQRSPTESLLITKNNEQYHAKKVIRDVAIKYAYATGTIHTSLFIDGQKAGLSDAQIMEMAGIFGWDIDFALEIRQGDSFNLLYEEHFLDGKKLRNGPILFAEFNNHKKTYYAIRYTTPDGETSYYDPNDGRNKKRAFIRTPVKFARISSRFSNNRYHPKLKKWRAHRGVDYAAPRGTPVKAAGKGKILFRGRKGGYGNTVMIQHGSKYVTLYAHLSKFSKASRKGKKVSQGQIIGYVGSTGLATGPHLHYEFRVNGVHRNPLTVKLPKAEPINKQYRTDFNHKSQEIRSLFNRYKAQLTQTNTETNKNG